MSKPSGSIGCSAAWMPAREKGCKRDIARAKLTADAAGDVMRLARQDANLPEITTIYDLQAYLAGRGLPDSVNQGASAAWERYRRSTGTGRSA